MKIIKLTTGEKVPKGAIHIQTIQETKDYGSAGSLYSTAHYFLVNN